MESTAYPLMIEPEELNASLADPSLLIVDLCRTEQYHSAHIPGAVHLPFMHLMGGEFPAPGKLPPVETLAKVLGRIGLQPHSHVVAYDDEGGGWAGRLLWTLDVIGHSGWSYLNGGLHAWAPANLPLENEIHTATTTTPEFYYRTGAVPDSPLLNKEDILLRLGQPDFVIWDARSAEEYLGLRPGAMQNGHIPGAVNYEWTRAMDHQNGLRIRPRQWILAELAELGISADKHIVTHCQSHHRSAFTYLLGKILGFRSIQAYPGSWSEWGNDPDMPVEST